MIPDVNLILEQTQCPPTAPSPNSRCENIYMPRGFTVFIFNSARSTFNWYDTTSWLVHEPFKSIYLLFSPPSVTQFYFYIDHKFYNTLLFLLSIRGQQTIAQTTAKSSIVMAFDLRMVIKGKKKKCKKDHLESTKPKTLLFGSLGNIC